MRRRSFLAHASAAVPAAALQRLTSELGSSVQGHEVHVVREGQDRFGEKHTLGYSAILFRVANADSGGGLFAIEHRNLGKGGPPEHIHLYQDEWFYVLEGEVLFRVGGQEVLVRAGESVLGPRRVPHCFAGAGERPARMLITFTPAGKMEAFFRAVAVPNGPRLDAALLSQYDMQYVGPGLAG
jgi:mannose-6-phosphate isomerase-like protein (cupin superfamily)